MKKQTEAYMKEHPQLTLFISVLVAPFAFFFWVYREFCFLIVRQFIRHFFLMPLLFLLLTISFLMRFEV
ncbi:hypothetical protein [Flavobacterium sp.]|uniref:hypothetical protein n=1 Tax=Flavobacterium sp. TaxID=239 RepID=UPI0037BFAD80